MEHGQDAVEGRFDDEGGSGDEGADAMAGTRAVLQKCILVLFRRLGETWPCLVR